MKTFRLLLVLLTFHFCSVLAGAQDTKPVFSLKIASPNQLVAIAESLHDIGKSIGMEDEELADFHTGIQEVKKQLVAMAKVVNADTDFALALNLNFDRLKAETPWDVFEPLAFLPVTDILGAFGAIGKIPGLEMVPPVIATVMKKDGDNYTFESMFMPVTVYAKQTKDCVVVGITDSVFKMDGNVKTAFKDLERFTVAAKIDLSEVKLDSVLKTVDAFVDFALEYIDEDMLSMMLEQLLVELGNEGIPGLFLLDELTPTTIRELVKQPIQTLLSELKSVSVGFAFDPKTKDSEYALAVTPQKGGELEKLIAGRKNARTMFHSFKPTPEETVYHFNFAYTIEPKYIAALLPLVGLAFDGATDGWIEAIENEGAEKDWTIPDFLKGE
jgi:hypothetical protein